MVVECEFVWCWVIDVKLGRVLVVEELEDVMLKCVVEFGDVYECNVFVCYFFDFGDEWVYCIDKVLLSDVVVFVVVVEEIIVVLCFDVFVVF